MSFRLTRDELLELFGSVGPVVDVVMPPDRVSGRPRGFAFVEYETDEDAAKAVEILNGKEVAGRTLRVDEASKRLPREGLPPPPPEADPPFPPIDRPVPRAAGADSGVASADSTRAWVGIEMKEILELIAKALVDNPDRVSVSEVGGQQTTIFELRVAQEDLGKVIGKQGHTARAIRTVLSAAGMKLRKRFYLEIIE